MSSQYLPIGPFIHRMFRLKPARWDWGRFLRAAICVGVPFGLGMYQRDIMPWMWIAMGTLMMTTGERKIAYRQRIPSLLGTSLLGAAGYLLGYLGSLPFACTLIVMAGVGYAACTLSRRGPDWSIGCLQLLLTASIAIGVPSIGNFWWPALLYLVGALIYAAVLAIEAFVVAEFTRHGGRSGAAGHAAKGSASKVSAANAATGGGIHSLPGTTVAPAALEARETPSIALALCLATAYAFKLILDASHWFWVPLTVGLIMKPDLGNIFDRAILRCLGTALGVAIASVILIHFPKDLWLAALIAVFAGVLPWCMAKSYALQAVTLTPLVLLLVDTIIPGDHNVNYSLQRMGDTVIGAAIVIVWGAVFRLSGRR
ncbi:FUSC family protein [Bordetella sp. 02P26C-1]|uniref:FUSC family protein n=1 Tax=Bordetella sp. 02P26C-1 TaxID=2683195 RepID=UPI001365CF87|nr:FUSC family protein [Bordetella sp. 02P26C-1]